MQNEYVRDATEIYRDYIADTALIDSHELAIKVLDALQIAIASIDAQLDAAAIQAGNRALSDDSVDWIRRAAFALAMKKRDYHKVFMRDKEIRGTKIKQQSDPLKKEANILKQKRLIAEAEARLADKQLKIKQLQIREMELAQKKP